MHLDKTEDKRVLLIEPSLMVSKGFATLMDGINGFRLVGSMQNVNRLQENCITYHPDVLVFNPLIMSFQHRTSIRSFFNLPSEIALVALVYSFVDEWILAQFDAVITINDDSTQLSNKLNNIKSATVNNAQQENEELSERENEILTSIVKGLTNKEIAEKHFISIHTVNSHRKNIIRKTGIKSVSGLTVYALLNNLISYEDIE